MMSNMARHDSKKVSIICICNKAVEWREKTGFRITGRRAAALYVCVLRFLKVYYYDRQCMLLG